MPRIMTLGRDPVAKPPMIHAPWSGQNGVFALTTTRIGGSSVAPFDDGQGGKGLNLAQHVGDHGTAVMANRAALMSLLPSAPVWLDQVHGASVIDVTEMAVDGAGQSPVLPAADAAVSKRRGQVLAIMTADCLPVLMVDEHTGVIGAAHAGWRGLAAGVLSATLTAMGRLGAQLVFVKAWIGPAIGPSSFEVGAEVPEAFATAPAFARVKSDAYFRPLANQSGKWLGDLPGLAKAQLLSEGLAAVADAQCCTVTDQRFYSYRRDGQTGRMASLIWLDRDRQMA